VSVSDIFKSYDIRGKVGTELTEEVCEQIARAFADWLHKKGIVAVGRDMRPDSARLAAAFIKGLTEQGLDVWDIGMVTSDMSYFAVGKFGLAGSAMITASHNTGDYNGIKLYRDHVTAVGLDSGLDQIRDAAIVKTFKPAASKPGKVEKRDISETWAEHCLSFITGLKPFHIAIDAGNGMAGAMLPHILPKLPLKVEELYFELDGTFPNHEANPMHLETLQDLTKLVIDKKLDFGIAFDGDGDRAAFVDDKGRPLPGTDLLAIVAHHYLQKYPGAPIVHEVRTSRATLELIKEWGGKPERVKAGRIAIGARLREIGAPFGGETTGHFFFKENYAADAGMITALVAIQAISDSDKKLSELADEYRRYQMSPEISFETDQPQETLGRVAKAFKDGEQDWVDGITVNYPDSWFNLRASNTEPLVKLNAEANTNKRLDELVAKISAVIKEA